jgi:hypothetical protein
MLLELAKLSKLQAILRVNSEELMAEVERNSDSSHALQCISLVAQCQKLERDVQLLAKAMLEAQEPQGMS